MKKFSSFLKVKKARADHFSWAAGDVVADESLEEWTADKPLSLGKLNRHRHATESHDLHRHEFSEHQGKLSRIHHEHINAYKGNSYSTNHYLRHGKHSDDEHYLNVEHTKDHIKHMDHVTSYQTKHPHTTYRGGVPSDIHRFKAGHKFQDHGYTGTSFRHSVAAEFSDNKKSASTKEGRRIIHVIHSPKGTKAHHVDHGKEGGLAYENEVVLHRGTKFKVTHHSQDDKFHYIHSRVVGNKAKKYDHGYPGRHHSVTGYEEHEKNQGVTKHQDTSAHHKFHKSILAKKHLVKNHLTGHMEET